MINEFIIKLAILVIGSACIASLAILEYYADLHAAVKKNNCIVYAFVSIIQNRITEISMCVIPKADVLVPSIQRIVNSAMFKKTINQATYDQLRKLGIAELKLTMVRLTSKYEYTVAVNNQAYHPTHPINSDATRIIQCITKLCERSSMVCKDGEVAMYLVNLGSVTLLPYMIGNVDDMFEYSSFFADNFKKING